MDYKEKWNIIEALGEGGQGKVFRVSKKNEEVGIQANLMNAILRVVRKQDVGHSEEIDELIKPVINSIKILLKLDDPENCGALKVLHDIGNDEQRARAKRRIKNEIVIMEKIKHPNFIEVIDIDDDFEWFVSKFYQNGTLSAQNDRFKGKLLKALVAIRPLVEAVGVLHRKDIVHRDIKPDNIFINQNNDLILGDFGIIYLENHEQARLSGTFEKVGSSDWMPPWVVGKQIGDVEPSFDIYSLGKVIWSMVSGKPGFPFWDFREAENNLVNIIPNEPSMEIANRLLSRCIVRYQRDCLGNAFALLKEIDEVIHSIKTGVDPALYVGEYEGRPCRQCGNGTYERICDGSSGETNNFGLTATKRYRIIIYTCNSCRHTQLFPDKNNIPNDGRQIEEI